MATVFVKCTLSLSKLSSTLCVAQSDRAKSSNENVRDIYETWGLSPRGDYDSKQDTTLGFGVV